MSNLGVRALKTARVVLCGLVLCAMRGPVAIAQNEEPKPVLDEVKAHYTKYEFRIPMRDGAHLFTVVYVPKDVSAGKTFPFFIQRAPYSVGPYRAGNYREHFGAAAGFLKKW